MANLDSIVNVTLSATARGISRRGFGTPLVMGRTDAFVELARVYTLSTASADLATDGIPVTDPINRKVAALARNTPKPQSVIVGRLTTDFTQLFDLTVKPITAVGGEVFSFSIVSPDGTVTDVSYTAIAADTATEVGAGLASVMTAVADFTAANTAGVIDCTAGNVNEIFRLTGVNISLFDFEETTVDTSLVTDLQAIQAVNDDWYCLVNATPNSNARTSALAAHVETLEKIFIASTYDTECGNPGSTTDVAYLLNASQYFRTAVKYTGDQSGNPDAVWPGGRLARDPGSQTWYAKVLSGVLPDALTANFMSALEAKSCNYYAVIAGAAITYNGRVAAGEWIDVIRGRDWLKVTMQEDVFLHILNSEKVPFTDPGIISIGAVMEASLNKGIASGFLAEDPPYIVTLPPASSFTSDQKQTRIATGLSFQATVSGAIHAVTINGALIN